MTTLKSRKNENLSKNVKPEAVFTVLKNSGNREK